MSLYHTIMHILSAGGDVLGTRIMGTLLESFREILPDEKMMLQKTGGPITWTGGPWVATPEIEEHLKPPSMTPSFRVLVERLSETLMKSIPVDTARFGISRGSRLQKKLPSDEGIMDARTSS